MYCDSYLMIGLMVIGGVVLALLGQLVTRKIIDFEKLKPSHDVGGYLLAVVGTLYAVLLGLVVVDAMQRFQYAREITEKEANSLADVFLLSYRLPESMGGSVRKICFDYTNEVVNNEWRHMDNGQYSPIAKRKAIELIRSLLSFEPKSENEKALYPQMISDVTQIWQNRRERINMAMNGVPAAEWVVLVLGGIITVFFTYFFGLDNLRLQLVMTCMVAMLISLNLSLLLMFGYPFSGDLCIRPDSFLLDQDIFKNHIVMKAPVL